MHPVVIGTHPDRAEWLADCLEAIRNTTDREILVHTVGGYEPTALRTGCATFDQFLFLHDSVQVLTEEFWHIIDSTPAAWLTGWPQMFLGVHETAQLWPVINDLPVSMSKAEVIHLEAHISSLVDYDTIWPTITDRTALRQEHKHGRDNLVLGNQHFEKWKGTWA